ncbi:FadR/GntR family transcriptional regulator [Pigmentiphaga litoralis]|uniref:GntR family transcriptional repressor for pyruvate dehydrogenase complex n=1 Tax=Pigmentiphaga litoralis TaxID=516702 RepID=A0A7Y9IWP0_9BURK|nr:FCD domain-containing protein [Pigmentiphaga litoralis]NYE22195.1 GntR family transcriptional repressor for pyruvate dehydrogenase complex [Pigmentiphaga litoralis]NYE84190.1 GntR family transcriptional repressor for pyruvate dehydrogenase complex [Pigmentiphaga litoralis]
MASAVDVHPRNEPNLTDRITQRLMDEITGGQYHVGDVLPPEQAIADRFGVSRTVLREAVSRLKSEGIVSSKQGRGLQVIANAPLSVLRIQAAGHDTAQILGIVELRRGVEIEAAALAAERRTATDLIDIRAALDAMAEAIATGDVTLGVEADLGFHRAIARATRNDNYILFFDFMAVLLRKNIEVSRRRSSKVSGRGAQAQKEHAKVFAAIEKGDPDMARQFARIHIVNTEARLRSAGQE